MSQKQNYNNLPDSLFIKINPWWKFWLWFRKRSVTISMVRELTGEPVMEYIINCGIGIDIVERRESDSIKCSGCGGEFIKTGTFDEEAYYKHKPELYCCNKCQGMISVMRYTRYGMHE